MPNKYKYNIIKRFIFGIMNKDDAKALLSKTKDESFFSELSEEMSDVWIHDVETKESKHDHAEYIYEASTILHKMKKPQQTRKRYLLLIASVAAVVALLIFSISHLVDSSSIDQSDIQSFALIHQADIKEIAETQLVISDKETILLEEKESTITYNEDGLVANQNDIAKEQIAPYNQLLTPKGKRSVLTFSDGSKAWVNAGTRVIYPAKFVGKEREIYVDGEIYIEVFKDKSRPFIVKTKDMNVQVLGTKFNVTAYEADATSRVVLTEGSVAVKSGQSKKKTGTVLSPNQMLELSDNKEIISNVNPNKYTSWVDGLYIFDDESLSVLTLALSRYYGVEVECEAEAAALLCTGKIDLQETIDEILELLTYSSPISYKKVGDKYYINKINP